MQVKRCQRNLDAFYSLSSRSEAEVLAEVLERTTDRCTDGLVLVFTSKLLVFKANEDDDSLSISSKNIRASLNRKLFQKSRSPIWQEFIGRAFGWGWATVNQQGYCDGALLSFDGITPGVFLAVVASSIEIGRIFLEEEAAQTKSSVSGRMGTKVR